MDTLSIHERIFARPVHKISNSTKPHVLQAILVPSESFDAARVTKVLRVGPENVRLLRGGVSARNKCFFVVKAA